MEHFWVGFEKAAELGPQTQEKPSLLRRALPAMAAGAAGLGAYALSRGRAKTKFTKTLVRDAPTSRLGRAVDRTLYGADAVHYIPKKAWKVTGAPSKPLTTEGTVLHAAKSTKKFLKGDTNLGSRPWQRHTSFENKAEESGMLNKAMPSAHTPTVSGRATGKGLKNLKALHGKHKKNDYLIKETHGQDSGVGGASFLHRADVEKHLSGGRLTGQKRRLLDGFLKNPEHHILQKKIDIAKDRLTGASSEFRVHVLDGKVVPNATSIRGKNITDHFRRGKAEAALQDVLNKVKSKDKKSLMMAADVARDTKGNYKVIELNRGPSISGFTSPRTLTKKHKGLPGLIAGANAVKTNEAIYKHVTGRHGQLSSVGRGALTAAAAGAGTAAAVREKGN